MKKTPLYQIHEQLGAKIIPFAGYEMPVRYTRDKAEHLAVRSDAGMFDVSHMGEFFIDGPHALELLQKISSNDVSRLVPGKAQYSCMPNHEGGIVDDLIIYRLGEESYMVVVNAANIQKDWDWISASNTMNANLIDRSEELALIAVSGPKAENILQQMTPSTLSELGTYYCISCELAEIPLTLATTGYTGERTFELFVPVAHAASVWNQIMETGKPHGLIPTGLGARDTLRLEMGYMLYGNDINDETSPLEAGLGWITKLKKGPFNGSEAIAKLKERGIQRKLVGFEIIARGIPRSGYEIAVNDEVVGKVTSGSMSPVLNKGIGLGYVPIEFSKPGQELQIVIRNKMVPAQVVKTPFIPEK